MQKPINISQSDLSVFEVLFWNRVPIHQYFSKLNSFLSNKLVTDRHIALASPKLIKRKGGKSSISWQYKSTYPSLISYLNLSEEDKIPVNKKVEYIKTFIGELLGSYLKEEQEWGELLDYCFKNIEGSSIFVNGEIIVFAGWGLRPLNIIEHKPFSGINKIRKHPIVSDEIGDEQEGDIEEDEAFSGETEKIEEESTIDEPHKENTKSENVGEDLPEINEELENNNRVIEPESSNIIDSAEENILPESYPDQQDKEEGLMSEYSPGLSGESKASELEKGDDKPQHEEDVSDKDSNDDLTNANQEEESESFDENNNQNIESDLSVESKEQGLEKGNDKPEHEEDVSGKGTNDNLDHANQQKEKPKSPDQTRKDTERNRIIDNNKKENNTANQKEDERKERMSDPSTDNSNNKIDRRSLLKHWWILILLIIFILVLFRMCKTPNPYNYLPEKPNIIPPIDSNEVIIDDQDSVRMIISDRLNIFIKNEDKGIEEFVLKFHAAFGKERYKIIYYDTLTRRIQIKVPKEEREILKREIPDKLKDFDLLIWYESIFSKNKRPSDPAFKDKIKAWPIKAVKAEEAWEKTFGKKEIIVAVIDDGFDINHQEFTDKIVKPWNVVNRNKDVFTNKNAAHGSHVAGTAIGKRDNNAGLSGIAPDCSLMPIQVADNNGLISSTAVIDALLYAINQGADVVNLSLGLKLNSFATFMPIDFQENLIRTSFLDEEAFWQELLEIAENSNVTVVMAGGNDNVLIGLDPMQRSPLAIKVSAVNPELRKAGFSNFGQYSTLSAPGVGVYSSVPGNNFNFMDGTSMAAPIVTGAIALLKSIKPEITTNEIRSILIETGKKINDDIGPLIQLDKAINAIDSSANDQDQCNDIQARIDSLQQKIEDLKDLCPDTEVIDTMKMPEDINDLDFTIGRWKSTKELDAFDEGGNKTGTAIIYFDFYKDKTGKITLVDSDKLECSSGLSLKIDQSGFNIDQYSNAVCGNSEKYYSSYEFYCKPDDKGFADCYAENKSDSKNKFPFRLVRIK